MKLMIIASLLLGGMICETARAQEEIIDIVGRLNFTSERSSSAYHLYYGVGSNYTDTTDKAYEQFIPPFTPPQDYLIVFERECTYSDGDPPCFWNEDLRGVPDSVKEGKQHFALTYRIRSVSNQTGAGFKLSILNPDWPDGLDSINIVDPIVPTAFNRTITGPITGVVIDQFTSRLTLTAYYTVEPASGVQTEEHEDNHLVIAPNPVLDGRVHVAGPLRAGDQLVVIDNRGERVMWREMTNEQKMVELQDDLPSGAYFLLHLDTSGSVLGKASFQIIR